VPAAVAALFGLLTFRLRIRDVFFSLVTQALVLAAFTFVVNQQPYTGGVVGMTYLAKLELFGRYDWVGRRYVDFFSKTAMPAYQTVGAGAAVEWKAWRFQVVGDNITNAKGLTEGNTRTDQFAGQGSAEAIYGRPLFGRNVRFILSRSW
jgi:hypothetical protein